MESWALNSLEEFEHFTLNVDWLNIDSYGSDIKENDSLKPATALSYENTSSLWFYNLCQNYLTNNSSHMTLIAMCEEILNLYKTSQKKPHPEEFFQDKIFELLGETCFDILSELLQNISKLREISITDIQNIESNITNGVDSNVDNDYDISDYQTSQHINNYDDGNDDDNDGINLNETPDWLAQLGFSDEYLANERSLGLQKGHIPKPNIVDDWRAHLLPEGSTMYYESKGLPAGTEKKVYPGYEEVTIPAATNKPIIPPRGLVPISELDIWAQEAFQSTKQLNTIQSIVYPAAYHTAQNLLICAPTGAGKTNIAMLTFLQLVKEHLLPNGDINKDNIKAIYVAPMKALAQEVVTKFQERLLPLKMQVKEYTGDMQLTKQEIHDSQLIVTTPEKYDVISRKGGEGSLSTLISLIIIDEVHLLADDRGAVIETIVARTQRYIESAQKCIRLVGLSATLPNYEDVAKFLKVNFKTGLFHFGSEYRPVPLSQTFIGITEKNKNKRNDFMNKQTYEKMIAALERDKQVMIFVHSRKETSKTAQAMIELSGINATLGYTENINHEKYTLWKKEVEKSRSLEVQNLFYKGYGVHHAGMARSDRNMTEELFQYGLIKVLCCTATLAWGVNLPAHTVIIKGTELYDPERGGFVDVSILDILQIFGRAGRPQYDNTGHAILITPHKTLDKYLGLLANQAPIESGLIRTLADHMNAEIVNGTINNIKDAVTWLSYTFLYIRMCKNPLSYGMKPEETYDDPSLQKRRLELVVQSAQLLDRCMMIRYDPKSGNLGVTDLGRIASHYYIKYNTIEAFNSMLNPHLSDVDALHVLCSSAEFDQLKLRPEELPEIDTLKKHISIRIKVPVEDTAGKVNLLLQSYLNQQRLTSFTLQSDTNYVAQNAGRITRALFELCLKRGWSTLTGHYLELCKSIDRRVRVDQSPLRQFYYDELPRDVLRRLEEIHTDYNELLQMTATDIGQFIRNHKYGQKVLTLLQKLPFLAVDIRVQPITRGILRVMVTLNCDFIWTDKYHGQAEPYWIWIEDGNNEYIYHSEPFILLKKQKDIPHYMDFTIPVREPLPPQYYLKVVSDRWLGTTMIHTVSFQHLILPDRMPPHTNLLNVHPIPKTALKNSLYESLYPKFSHFNTIQSQVFHSLYHKDINILVGAPTGSGKTIISELAILRLLNTKPTAKIVYVAPLKALARERVEDWKFKLGDGLGLHVLELTGDNTPDIQLLQQANLLIVTPEKWDSISRGWQKREYVQKVELLIIDEIHLLGVDRGAVLEVIVSRMRFISTQMQHNIRFVGLSTALANPRDLADWLGIGPIGVYNFRPSVRPIPMTIHIQGFPGKHYCPRMATMNKPTYAAICEHSPSKPALIFVSSRRQTRLTALDLISYCAADENPKKFLHMSEDEIMVIAETLKDNALKNTIIYGVALHHAGLDNHDRKTVETLYLHGKIQILVATSTLAWGVNLPCHLVIVKGTEFFDGKTSRYINFDVTDILQMMGRAGRPQFDDTGVACVFVHEPLKNFYRKFLFEPFPVESSLHKHLHEHINAEIVSGVLTNIEDCIEYLTWTYYFRRLTMNPSYYQLEDCTSTGILTHLKTILTKILKELMDACCIEYTNLTDLNTIESSDFQATILGKITSYYYLDYRTVDIFVQGIESISVKLLQQMNNNNNNNKKGSKSTGTTATSHESSLITSMMQPIDSTATVIAGDIDKMGPDLLRTTTTTNTSLTKPSATTTTTINPDKPVYTLKQQEKLQTKYIERFIKLICEAYEFSEIPVRHNEDLLNAELAKNVPWGIDYQKVGESNTKAFLLIQAHLYHVTLPIMDYINDTKSVLDQIPRVLNALIDVAADMGKLDVVLSCAKISQMIFQGLGNEASEFLQLPGMTPDLITYLERKHIHTLLDVLHMSYSKREQLFQSLLSTTTQSSSISRNMNGDKKSYGNTSNGYDDEDDEYLSPLHAETTSSSTLNISEIMKRLSEIPVYEASIRVKATPIVPITTTTTTTAVLNKPITDKLYMNTTTTTTPPPTTTSTITNEWIPIPIYTQPSKLKNTSTSTSTSTSTNHHSKRSSHSSHINGNSNSKDGDKGIYSREDSVIDLPIDCDCLLEIQLIQTHGQRYNAYNNNNNNSGGGSSTNKQNKRSNGKNDSGSTSNSNNSSNSGVMMKSNSKYHKPKSLSWWFILGSLTTGELIAIKRIGNITSTFTTTIEFITPNINCIDEMCLYIVNDSMLGIDMKYYFTFQT